MPLPAGGRQLALAVHLAVSIGWMGAAAAYLALDVAAAAGEDAVLVRAAYLAMDLIARTVIVPLAFATLVTGVVVSVGTKWGLFRHYWVVISLAMTVLAVAVLLMETAVIAGHAEVARSAAAGRVIDLPSTLPHSAGGIVVLSVVLVLNVYKPRGLTAYGRRLHARRGEPPP